ncbi:MAG TPA: hypothetical protein VEQ58_00270 [Polyangiaceae bacterium]|nr:hypothetical protein [Polyangiaceae bacterium]
MSKKQPIAREIRGTVTATNISPKGVVEGVLVDTGKGLIQLNFPKHAARGSSATFTVGQQLQLQAKLETDEYEHPVYELAETETSVAGAITRLNYARHGEINGFHLDDGTFVHLTPEIASEYDLRVGAHAAASGALRLGDAATVIDARRVELSKPPRRARA